MSTSYKSEPAYIHIILILIIVGLTYLLIQVAILEPQRVLEQERYWKEESRLRMTNLKQLELLYKEKMVSTQTILILCLISSKRTWSIRLM